MKNNSKNASKSHKPNKAIITLSIIVVLLLATTATLAIMLANRSGNSSSARRPGSSQAKDNTTRPTPNNSLDNNPSSSNASDNYISSQAALDTALAHLGTSQSSVRDIDVDLEYKLGQVIYEVNFNLNQYEYEYYIDATTGEILKSFKELDY